MGPGLMKTGRFSMKTERIERRDELARMLATVDDDGKGN
jgi:hypothetical protein